MWRGLHDGGIVNKPVVKSSDEAMFAGSIALRQHGDGLFKHFSRLDGLEAHIVSVTRGISVIICRQAGRAGERAIKDVGLTTQRAVKNRRFRTIEED